MHLESIKLTNFKNYEGRKFSFSPRLNCLTGLNGVGKTNVLDAAYYLCLTKNSSGLSDKNLIRHGADFFRLEGAFIDEKDKSKVVAKYQAGQKKVVERNGVVFERLADYVGRFPVVMIAPDDVALIQEGSEDRRRFLDATLSQMSAEYLHQLITYNALLKQRNALLKAFAEQRRFDAALLEGIDRQMPAPAQVIFEARKAFLTDFQPVFEDCYAAISGSRESVSLAYASDLADNGLAALLTQNIDKDRLLQRSTAGVHKDDISLWIDEQPVKKFASQGQVKSYLLAMRLAQYELLRREKGSSPILLLDDIFDKLDALRVRQLIALLLERDYGQIFITDTQRERVEGIVASFGKEYRVFDL